MQKMGRMQIISLTANQQMAKQISISLGLGLHSMDVYHFVDGEILVAGKESIRGSNVYIVQSTCPPVTEHLMELLLCIDACRRADAKSITCVIPYFGYARQDRKVLARQPISARLVADLLETAGANRIVSCDLHATQIAGFFRIPVDDISPVKLFCSSSPTINFFNTDNKEGL